MSDKSLSRREALKVIGTAAATVVGMSVLKGDTPRSPERELNSQILVLDFFNVEKAQDRFLEENFPAGFDINKAFKEMGISDPNSREGLQKGVPKNEEQAKLFMMKAFEVVYKDHGKDVLGVMGATRKFFGKNANDSDYVTQSAIGAVDLGKIEFDEIGNPTLHRNIDSKDIDNLVSNFSGGIVNLSLELGDGMMTYEIYESKLKYPELGREMPYTRGEGENVKYYDYMGNELLGKKDEFDAIVRKSEERIKQLLDPNDRTLVSVDGYSGEETYNNLKMLCEVVNKHPDKIFFAAGGNPSYLKGVIVPDIREAKKRLEAEGLWNGNLKIIGFEINAQGSTFISSLGADFYIKDEDLETLGFFGASSYATPVLSDIADQLIEEGFNTNFKIDEVLTNCSTLKTGYSLNEEMADYNLINLQKIKVYL